MLEIQALRILEDEGRGGGANKVVMLHGVEDLDDWTIEKSSSRSCSERGIEIMVDA